MAKECPLWHAGLAMSTYEGSERLKDFFVVTSLSSDKQGAVYISTMEARKVGKQSSDRIDTVSLHGAVLDISSDTYTCTTEIHRAFFLLNPTQAVCSKEDPLSLLTPTYTVCS